MNKRQRKRIAKCYRMAALVDARMLQRIESRYPVADSQHWADLNHLRRQYDLALSRGWIAAAKRIRRKSYAVVESLRREINTLGGKLTALFEATSTCSTRDLCADLLSLYDRFADVEFDWSKQLVTVTTEPIELEDIYLGPFRICLDLKLLGESRPYQVRAVDPHPASSCDLTTHPHVSDGTLCEGAGREPIRRSLADGRLYDFFAIARQILRTYDPLSAYINLEDWYGTVCRDCGTAVSRAESCYRCGEQSCCDCVCSCGNCSESFCGECVLQCDGCGEKQCEQCLQPCKRCDERFCQQCLTESKCDNCIEKESEETAAETQADTPKAAVHTLRTSQADVPT